jgi:cysteine synthase
MIGNTPLVRIASLSLATGCEILGKAESLNPGGSSKDRVAKQILDDAEASGALRKGGTLVEGSSGSTGISLATLARARGYRCHIVMPDDQAAEKATLLRTFGATVELVKPVAIVNADHYVNIARRRADELVRGGDGVGLAAALNGDGGADLPPLLTGPGAALFCDQFECASNFRAHFLHTGPEIWEQTGGGGLDAFVMGAGTGGTIAGVGAYLRAAEEASSASAAAATTGPSGAGAGALPAPGRRRIRLFLADPPGSSLYNRVVHGVAFAPQQAERSLRRHRYDTIIEGVGLDRLTANVERALPHIDGAFSVTDQEAVDMSRYLLRNDGLFVGSSTAMNLVASVKAARLLGPGHRIVTLLCDSGSRHISRFWNSDFLATRGLVTATAAAARGTSLDFVA